MYKHPWVNKISVLSGFLRRVLLTNKSVRYGIIFLITFIFIFFALLFNYSVSSIDKKSLTVVVDIPTGSSFLEITEILDKAGLIKNHFLFYSLAFIKRATRHIRAGEYEFNTSITTPWAMINKLMRGKIKKYEVIIREDLSLRDIAVILNKDKLINKEIFFELARDKDFLESLNIEAESIEGYLFPDRYEFDRSMNTRRIMKKMVDTFWKRVTPSMRQRASDLKLNMNQFVTLASIIGKESGNSFEKPFISAVFYNRMKRGMRLQSDPTAVYDMDNFEGKVLRSHLRRKSPYNTYLIKGLPPGPIGNPGLYSLKAAINPAPIECFYFVSKKDGTHHFSSSLEEHNQAVNRYKKIKDEQIQQLKDNVSNE
ncbi:MAG: endolytic transglycosylase MltG [Syntrophaceae bacterium]|nr:endolytic transglycosylase MltG [Syntrophaceae bacterium]